MTASTTGREYLEQLQDRYVRAVAADRGIPVEAVHRVPLPPFAEPVANPYAQPQRPDREQLEDSAARAIAAVYGVPIDDVMVNGRRYGDLVRARRS